MSNLVRRVVVAIVGIPLLLFVTITGEGWLVGFVVLLQLTALFEWRSLARGLDASIFLPSLVVGIVGLDFLVIGFGKPHLAAAGIFSLGIWLTLEVFRADHRPLRNLSLSALFLLYVCFPLALWTQFSDFQNPVRFSFLGPLTVLFIATWFCDSGAYFGGRAFGKHKLYPAASPNKTIEGAIAGLLCAAIVLPIMILANWARPASSDLLFLPLCVGIFGQTGDLLESLMKREIQVKDASSILPGHGGILDRFDSLLISTPFFFAYLLITSG